MKIIDYIKSTGLLGRVLANFSKKDTQKKPPIRLICRTKEEEEKEVWVDVPPLSDDDGNFYIDCSDLINQDDIALKVVGQGGHCPECEGYTFRTFKKTFPVGTYICDKCEKPFLREHIESIENVKSPYFGDHFVTIQHNDETFPVVLHMPGSTYVMTGDEAVQILHELKMGLRCLNCTVSNDGYECAVSSDGTCAADEKII